MWAILGNLHNTTGPAKTKTHEDFLSKTFTQNWYLYGVHLSEENFRNIKTYQAKYKNPLWVAFLREFKLLDDTLLTSFTDEFGNWDSELPTNWLLQAFNVTEEKWDKFAKKVYQTDTKANYRHDGKLEFKPTHFHQFLEVIKHEENKGIG